MIGDRRTRPDDRSGRERDTGQERGDRSEQPREALRGDADEQADARQDRADEDEVERGAAGGQRTQSGVARTG